MPEKKSTNTSISVRRPAFSRRRHSVVNGAIAVGIAVLLWSYVNARNIETRVLEARIDIIINPAADWEFDGAPPPSSVKVTVSGPSQAVRSLRPFGLSLRYIVPVPENAGSVHAVSLALMPDKVQSVPSEVTVTALAQHEIKFQLARMVEKQINVKIVTTGKPDPGFHIGYQQVEPVQKRVRLPEKLYQPSLVLQTEPINLAARNQPIENYPYKLLPLELADGRAVRPLENEWVNVTVQIVEKLAKRKFEKVPVRVLVATPDVVKKAWRLDPPQVTVHLEGRADKLKEFKQAGITIYVDTRDMGSSTEKSYPLKCHALVPGWVNVLKIEPAQVKWVRQ